MFLLKPRTGANDSHDKRCDSVFAHDVPFFHVQEVSQIIGVGKMLRGGAVSCAVALCPPYCKLKKL